MVCKTCSNFTLQLAVPVWNCSKKVNEEYFVAFLFSMLDWAEKLHVAKCANWASKQPCPVCNISRSNHGGRQSSVCGTHNMTLRIQTAQRFKVENMERPMCELLEYCNPFKAFPIEPMHTLFVDGVVGQFAALLFSNCKELSQALFFVCDTC